jgi:hypothetical protein
LNDSATQPTRPAGVAGHPTLYRKVYDRQALKLCLLGATDAELAGFFEVSGDTIIEWRRVHATFSESIARGKIVADANVAERLYLRALGYSHPAVKFFMPAGATEPVVAHYVEHYPPDTPAASLWLRNRQPAKWRDKASLELSGADGGPIIIVTGVPRPGDDAAGAPEGAMPAV